VNETVRYNVELTHVTQKEAFELGYIVVEIKVLLEYLWRKFVFLIWWYKIFKN